MARVLDVAHDAVAGPNRRRGSPILRGAGAGEHEENLLRSGVGLLDRLAGCELEAAQAHVQSSRCLAKVPFRSDLVPVRDHSSSSPSQ